MNGQARAARWGMLIGMFLLILGAKLWVIDQFGNAVPYMDQWASEGTLIKGYVEGTLGAGQIFASNNEHRIVFSKLLSLALISVNKQWDGILEMAAQAPLHVAAVVAFVWLAGAGMRPVGRVMLGLFAAGLSMAPFGWENTLWGFQSAFYFMMLFGVAAIWLCWRHEALTFRWWMGVLAALAAILSNGGGSFYVIAIAGFLTLRTVVERGGDWRGVFAAGLLGIVGVLGLVITPHVAGHGKFVAGGIGEFGAALMGSLSWPCDGYWGFIILQAPFVALAILILVQKRGFADGAWFPVILGTAYWFQIVATAYMRCKIWNSVRYYDSWCMLLIINCACLYFIAEAMGGRRRMWSCGVAAVWLGTCCHGLLDKGVNRLPGDLVEKRARMVELENDIRGYLTFGKPDYLTEFENRNHYGMPMLREMLDSDSIRKVLPSSLINPNPALLPMAGPAADNGGFITGGYPAGVPALNKPALGTYSRGVDKFEGGVSLSFQAPPGTRQIDLQIAGYPKARGMDLSIKERHGIFRKIVLPANPGNEWETVSIAVKSGDFKINARARSDTAWFAFSAPTVSTAHLAGQWARGLVGCSLPMIDVGLVLLGLGAVGSLREN